MKPGPVIGLVIGSLTATAQACPVAPGDGARINDREVVLAWRAEPQPIPIGRHFRLRVLACSASGAQLQGPLAIDAQMPAHRHGMNYRPSVTRAGDGSFEVEGMLFHMPGHWQITFELGGGMARRRLTADVTVE